MMAGGWDNGIYALGGGGVVWLAQMVWNRVFSTEGKANDLLVQQMAERLAAQETRLTSLEAGLDEERAARRKAEDKVHALEIDNLMLRHELKRHGIDIPPAAVAAAIPGATP